MAVGHTQLLYKGREKFTDPLKGANFYFPYNLQFPPMGRQSSDPIVIHSSIALLQERFRRLQRAKEMREERELLRLFSQSPGVNPTEISEPSRSFFQSELILPHRPLLPGSLSSQPNLHIKHSDLQVIETPILVNLGPSEKVYQASKNFDDSDVDTSLHL